MLPLDLTRVDLSKCAALPSPGRNWAGAARPQLNQSFSNRFALVYQFCVASLAGPLM